MKKTTKKKPVKTQSKIPPSPAVNPLEELKNQPSSTSSISETESNLDTLIKQIEVEEQQSKDTTAGDQSIPQEENPADLEIYKRLVPAVCFVVSFGIDKLNRRFLNSEFVPINKEQVAMMEDDLSHVLKDSLDKILPKVAKDNPRLVGLALILGSIYAANTRKLPPPQPVKEAPKTEQQPVHAHGIQVEVVQ